MTSGRIPAKKPRLKLKSPGALGKGQLGTVRALGGRLFLRAPRDLGDSMKPTPVYLPLLLALSCSLSGCLSDSYTIPDEEIVRLSELPPEERPERVRVIQRWGTEDEPLVADTRDCLDPEADPYTCRRDYNHHHTSSGVYLDVVHVHHTGVRRHRAVPRPVHSSVRPVPGSSTVQAAAPGSGTVHAAAPGSGTVHAAAPGSGTVHAPAPGSSESAVGTGTGAAPTDASANLPGETRPQAEAGTGSTSQSSGSSLDVDGDKAAAIVFVVAAVALTVGLAVTEGKRWDGWADVDIDQPVHFLSSSGAVTTVRLSDLHPDDIHLGEAIILEDEGMIFLERAPLDRQGFVWRMEGGMRQVNTPDDEQPMAPAATVSIGYFPLQSLGLLFSTTVAGGEQAGGDFIAWLYGLELDFIPLHWGFFHLGAYGALSMGYSAAEGGSLVSRSLHEPAYQAGLMAEFDLTTRLGLSTRFGILSQTGPEDEQLPLTLLGTVGLSVY